MVPDLSPSSRSLRRGAGISIPVVYSAKPLREGSRSGLGKCRVRLTFLEPTFRLKAVITNPKLKEEQEAFDKQLPDLLPSHQGQFVLFKDGKPVEFFDDHPSAYRAALDEFGLDATFLIAPVVESHPEPISIAWDAGVMFG